MGFKDVKERLGRRFRCWIAGVRWVPLLISAGALMLAGVLIRAVCGSPYAHGVLLKLDTVIPPVWLMTLLWMLWYAVLGATFAAVLTSEPKGCASQAEKYRGGMFFLAMLFLGFLWYPLFFVAARLFLSALVVLLVLALCVLAAITFRRCGTARGAGIVLFLHAGFLVYMLILNLSAAFHA